MTISKMYGPHDMRELEGTPHTTSTANEIEVINYNSY